ncbi:MAG: PhzF family phenazine biosynthesis protein [Myxococcales bacterium]|nr:PhzF family phenazine biosynthesis protein [Myxococcales bacterium]
MTNGDERVELRFATVDVFTERAFGGNPLAVFPDARGLSDAAMQRIAREMNLSETTFVLPPADAANDFCVRIFTPAAELPMAGHPTVGTAHVLATRGAVDLSRPRSELRFELGVGPVPVAIECRDGAVARATMQQPLALFGTVREDRSGIAALLGLAADDLAPSPVQAVSCGVPFLIVPLRSSGAAARARLDAAASERALRDFEAQEVLCFSTECATPGALAHARVFAPRLGIVEDPATGGAAGPLGAYLVRYGLVAPAVARAGFAVEQGIEMGRPSRIEVRLDVDDAGAPRGVFVGGACVPVTEGVLAVRRGDLT